MVVEIPGFYYDTEKKRYFKIVPNHHRVSNPSSSSSTNSTEQNLPNYHIQRVREEKERERQLKNKLKKSKIKVQPNQNTLTLLNDKLINCTINNNINNLRNKQIELNRIKYKRTIFRGVRGICKINGNENNTLIGFNNGYLKLINNSNNLELNFNLGHSQSNVSSINFINNNLMICTQKGGERKSGSLHVLNYDQSNNTHEFRQLYQNSTAHSMVYNSCFNKNLVAIGCDNFVQLYNLRESNINFYHKLKMNNKSVYSLKFDPFERNILFLGLRSGQLQLVDCRERSAYIADFSPLKGANYSIAELFPLSFRGIGNQVITVGSDGTVVRLDLRKRGIYFPIKGHTGDIQHPNFGTYLSEDESLLALAGNEGCVRFWDPLDGQLLIDPKTIQFPNMVKSLYSLNSKDFGSWMICHDNLIQHYSSHNY